LIRSASPLTREKARAYYCTREEVHTLRCDTMDVKEAAYRLGISPQFCRRLIKDGQLPAVRLGNKALRVTKVALDALLASRNAAQ